MKSGLRCTYVILMVCVIVPFTGLGAYAQSASSSRPDSASLLRDTKPNTGAATRQHSDGLTVAPTQKRPDVAPGGAKVQINEVLIQGASIFTQASLLELIGHIPDERYDMAGLQSFAVKITDYYKQNGYPFAYAYLPAQLLSDGSLIIEVLEGRYGAITLSQGDASPIWPALLGPGTAAPYLNTLRAGDVINQDKLSRSVLILKDVPGSTFTSVLRPGAELGTADLEVAVSQKRRWDGASSIHNYGNTYSGDITGRVSLDYYQFLMFADILSFSVSDTDGDRREYVSTYNFPLGGKGLRGGLLLSRSKYSLSEDFEGFSGKAQTASLSLRYPHLRSTKTNLYSSLKYNYDKLSDALEGAILNEKTYRSFSYSLNFDHTDDWLGGGISYGIFTLTRGSIQSGVEAEIEDQTYTKVVLNASRNQVLPGPLSLFINGQLQASSAMLDSLEHISLGGPYNVRAYPIGEASASEGGYLKTELLYGFDRYQAFSFYDVGYIRAEDTIQSRTLSGYGIGLRGVVNSVEVSLSLAWKDKGGISESGPEQRSPQIWVQVDHSF